MKRVVLLAVAVPLLVGCGSDTAGTSSAAKPEAPAATAKPAGPRAAVAECVEGSGFTVSRAGNATRVESPAGRRIANLMFFASKAKAAAFDAQLEVPQHATGGQAVAVYLDGAKDADRAVVTDCLDG